MNSNREFLIDTIKGTGNKITACYIITNESDRQLYFGDKGELPPPCREPDHMARIRVKDREAVESLESLKDY